MISTGFALKNHFFIPTKFYSTWLERKLYLDSLKTCHPSTEIENRLWFGVGLIAGYGPVVPKCLAIYEKYRYGTLYPAFTFSQQYSWL